MTDSTMVPRSWAVAQHLRADVLQQEVSRLQEQLAAMRRDRMQAAWDREFQDQSPRAVMRRAANDK